MDAGNFPPVASVSYDPHRLPTMVPKKYNVMTPTISKPDIESDPVYSSSSSMHSLTEESNCFEAPHVSRNFNSGEASYLWPAWVNYPSRTTQNSAFKNYASTGRKGVAESEVARGTSTDVAEALTLLGGWPSQTFE